ncbi:type II toxin-antitoxin system Phd/YefM family antitoxin [Phascolarctobacterium sp.]|uniref:type II toxin-antitoxin system Phd/YefM family antitoxin n=1 Tax=Phascolarctobacterium sp. TaxID=2049039 RepID=UPI0026DCEAD9|nr:hypothetical protein [Phascolarctobacterium sp.]
MMEAKNDLSKLIRMLETNQEDVIIIARNGTAVAQITLIPPQPVKQRLGIAAGKFKVPKDFMKWDEEVENMFEEEL